MITLRFTTGYADRWRRTWWPDIREILAANSLRTQLAESDWLFLHRIADVLHPSEAADAAAGGITRQMLRDAAALIPGRA